MLVHARAHGVHVRECPGAPCVCLSFASARVCTIFNVCVFVCKSYCAFAYVYV